MKQEDTTIQELKNSAVEENYKLNKSLTTPENKTTDKVIKDQKELALKRKLKKFQKSVLYNVLLGIFVLYVVFGSSIRLWGTTLKSDSVFFILTIISIIFFSVDIFILIKIRLDYLGSFLFFQELFNLISLFLDIGWIYENFFYCSNCQSYKVISYAGYKQGAVQMALTYEFVVKFIRLFRITYFMKFDFIFGALKRQYFNIKNYRANKKVKGYVPLEQKNSQSKFEYNEEYLEFQKNIHMYINPRVNDFNIKHYQEIYDKKYQPEEEDEEQFHNLGEELSSANIKRILVICLIQVLLIPILSLDCYSYPLSGQKNAVQEIGFFARKVGINEDRFTHLWNKFIADFENAKDYKLLQLNLYTKIDGGGVNVIKRYGDSKVEEEIVKDLRTVEFIGYAFPEKAEDLKNGDYFATALINRREPIISEAWLNTLMILFSMFILFLIAFFIDRDTNKLIVNPFNEMMEKIKAIQKNPVDASKKAEEEQFQLEILLKKDPWRRMQEKEKQRYETSLLIKTLQKSGTLLALGLGEAGTEIIIKNLEQDKLNPLIKGKKVICIFGFCDIKYFSELTEILKDGVINLVNTIAEIVHQQVDIYAGACNKNLGDAFLIVWKFRGEDLEEVISFDDDGFEKIDINLKKPLEETNAVTYRCELAVLSYLKIILNVQRSKKLRSFESSQQIKKVIPDFKIKMNFGLHIGWAIEGAIGSNHKIDASYLSPNVNLASRLEAASKQYGVPVLISGQIHERLSKDVGKQFRLLDIVNLKGSKQAMRLYTYDINLSDLPPGKSFFEELEDLEGKKTITPKIKKRLVLDFRNKINFFHMQLFQKGSSSKKLLIADDDLRVCRKNYTKKFFDKWEEGFKFYQEGIWFNAKTCFQESLKMIEGHEDGPSKNLIAFIESFNSKAPANWNGVRSLMSK